MSINRLSFFIFVLMFSLTAHSNAQLEITFHSIDGGGGRSVGGSFDLECTIGETEAGVPSTGGMFELVTGYQSSPPLPILLGDVNLDGTINLLDVGPFIDRLANGTFQVEADCNEDGVVNLLDVEPFIAILSGG